MGEIKTKPAVIRNQLKHTNNYFKCYMAWESTKYIKDTVKDQISNIEGQGWENHIE